MDTTHLDRIGTASPELEALVLLISDVNSNLQAQYGLDHYNWYTEDSGRRIKEKVAKGHTH